MIYTECGESVTTRNGASRVAGCDKRWVGVMARCRVRLDTQMVSEAGTKPLGAGP